MLSGDSAERARADRFAAFLRGKRVSVLVNSESSNPKSPATVLMTGVFERFEGDFVLVDQVSNEDSAKKTRYLFSKYGIIGLRIEEQPDVKKEA